MNRREMLTGVFKVACVTPPITVLAAERAAASYRRILVTSGIRRQRFAFAI